MALCLLGMLLAAQNGSVRKKHEMGRVVVPVLRKLRQENHCEVEATLGYNSMTLSQKEKKKKSKVISGGINHSICYTDSLSSSILTA